ncbi:MAG: OmpA family protein [Candidatus Korobacteraceae bacterium]
MSSSIRVVPRYLIATTIAVMFALCLSGTYAAAQVTIQPKDEIYVGYSWLHPGGHYDFALPTKDISSGIDISNVYYLRQAHNLGVLVDSSMHWGSDYGGPGNAADYYVLGGLQYKYHTDTFSPFFRVFAGALRQVAPGYPGTTVHSVDQWNAALGAGGGFDYNVWHGDNKTLAIRVAQVDYIYSNYSQIFPVTSPQWNSVRLSAGLVLGLGNYYNLPPTAACTAQPTEVTEGEPVTVTATGANFNPKHTVTYAWTTNGGKLDATDKSSARIDTTGLVEPNPPNPSGKSFTATATISDPKVKKGGSATCTANFTVNPRQLHPPQVSCSANPATVKAGDPSTITAMATSPDSAQITGYAYTATAGTVSGTATTATLDTASITSSQTVTVTVTATDARNLTGTNTCQVTVEKPVPLTCSKINSIQFPDLKRPWRVDNTAKAILDDVASRLKADPNAKIVIIGYADGEKAPMVGTGKNRHPMNLAAQRAVNAKAYLVQQQGIDPSRVEVRQGTGQQKVADIIWVPQGADENACADLQNTTPVDESMVKPSENAYPKPRMAPAMHHHKSGMAGAAQSTGDASQSAGNAVVQGTETAATDVGKAAKKTGHAVKKGAVATKDAVTPQQ